MRYHKTEGIYSLISVAGGEELEEVGGDPHRPRMVCFFQARCTKHAILSAGAVCQWPRCRDRAASRGAVSALLVHG